MLASTEKPKETPLQGESTGPPQPGYCSIQIQVGPDWVVRGEYHRNQLQAVSIKRGAVEPPRE
jgi:hypothetical protein